MVLGGVSQGKGAAGEVVESWRNGEGVGRGDG